MLRPLMTRKHPDLNNSRLPALIGSGLGTFCFPLLFAVPAFAQRADVPEVDRQGNFRSTRVQGNRGFYQQTHWLVVDRDPGGLNCRPFKPDNKPEVSLQYGSIVRTDVHGSSDDGISVKNGQPWLRVKADPSALQRDYRTRDRNRPVQCIVRANSSFIAPINMDDLRSIRWQ